MCKRLLKIVEARIEILFARPFFGITKSIVASEVDVLQLPPQDGQTTALAYLSCQMIKGTHFRNVLFLPNDISAGTGQQLKGK